MNADVALVTAIVPVKRWGLAKTRLNVGTEVRTEFARSFTLDVLEAVFEASRIGQVVVVTAEDGLSANLRRRGAACLPDRPLMANNGINGAISSGMRWARMFRPRSPVLVVPSDLACLTPSGLDGAIGALAAYPIAFVPNARGDGTTLMWARSPFDFETRYGPGSARRHSTLGAVAVAGVDAVARMDVDTKEDLMEARRIGIGRNSATVLGVSTTRV